MLGGVGIPNVFWYGV